MIDSKHVEGAPLTTNSVSEFLSDGGKIARIVNCHCFTVLGVNNYGLLCYSLFKNQGGARVANWLSADPPYYVRGRGGVISELSRSYLGWMGGEITAEFGDDVTETVIDLGEQL